MSELPARRHLVYYHGTESDALKDIKKHGLRPIESAATSILDPLFSGEAFWGADSISSAEGFAGRALRNKAQELAGLTAGEIPTSDDVSPEVLEKLDRAFELERSLSTAILRFRIPKDCPLVETLGQEQWKKVSGCSVPPELIDVCYPPPNGGGAIESF